MAGNEHIAVELRVRNQQLANDLRKSTAEVKRLERSFQELGNTGARVERQVNSVAKSTRSLSVITKAFAAIGVVGFLGSAAASFSKYASAIQGANNQLRSVSSSSEEFNRLSAGTLQIANQTGTAFEGVANSVARFTRALSDYGGTADQALLVTDTMTKAFLVTGASTTEATSALQQLGQALESGLLSGDEFRSIRENAPLAAKAIAKSLGVSLGELRKLSEQGKLTTDIVAQALIGANEEINKAAGKIPLTLERSLTVASNTFKDFIADSDGLNSALSAIGEGAILLANQLAVIGEELFSVDTSFDQTTQRVLGLSGPIDLLVRALQGLIAGFYTVGKAIKLVLDLAVNFATVFPKLLNVAFETGAKNLDAFGQLFEDGMLAVFQLDGEKLKAAATEFGSTVARNISEGLGNVGGVLGDSLSRAETDLSQFADGVIAQWENIGVRVEATTEKWNAEGELKKTAESLDAANKAAEKLLATFEKLTQQLQDYAVSQRSLPEQAQAEYEALIAKTEAYTAAAKAAGQAVDDALLSEVKAAAFQELNDSLADFAQQWRDVVPPVNEAEAAARAYADKMREIAELGKELGKTTEEIEAQQQAFRDAVASEEFQRFKEYWVEVGKTVIDVFGDAFQSIVDGSESAKDALRSLLEQLLILIAKAAILTALGGGSFASNLGGQILGRSGNGGGGGDGGGRAFGPFSSRNSGSTVRIYNQGGGLVSTQTRSNGDVDVMIGALATAVSRGGNNFDAVMRRTYGLDRRGV